MPIMSSGFFGDVYFLEAMTFLEITKNVHWSGTLRDGFFRNTKLLAANADFLEGAEECASFCKRKNGQKKKARVFPMIRDSSKPRKRQRKNARRTSLAACIAGHRFAKLTEVASQTLRLTKKKQMFFTRTFFPAKISHFSLFTLNYPLPRPATKFSQKHAHEIPRIFIPLRKPTACYRVLLRKSRVIHYSLFLVRYPPPHRKINPPPTTPFYPSHAPFSIKI